MFSGKLIVFSQASYLGLHNEMILGSIGIPFLVTIGNLLVTNCPHSLNLHEKGSHTTTVTKLFAKTTICFLLCFKTNDCFR